MSYSLVLLVSAALGLDALSVAMSLAMCGIKRRSALIFALLVAALHVLMPLAGIYFGFSLGGIAGDAADTIGSLVLLLIGIIILWKASREVLFARKKRTGDRRTLEEQEPKKSIVDLENPAGMLVLCISVSMDALAAGVGLGSLRADIFRTVLTMGLVAGGMTLFGFLLGKRLGRLLGEWTDISGGLLLVAIAIKTMFF